MANIKISDMVAASAANLTDILEKVNDPAGTPQNQKVTLAQVKTLILAETGLLYPANNPNGFLNTLSGLSTSYVAGVSGVLQSQISNINNNTGNFISQSQTGQFYPRNQNPSGYLTGLFIQPSITGSVFSAITINWSGASTFNYYLTGNTIFSFVGQLDGQTIVTRVKSTGAYTVSWPSGGITGIKWPNNNQPVQTTGTSNNTDIYTFIDISNTIYGNAVQGF